MSLLLTFMELDKLYESTMSRQDLIDHIKASGRNYNLDNKSTAQLFRIWERIQKEDNEIAGMQEYHDIVNSEQKNSGCSECGIPLSDGGLCPVCDDGEEDFFEWLDAAGNQAKTAASQTTKSTSSKVNAARATSSSGVNIVTIVHDNSKHRLRAQADDGIHGKAYVAFPNNLRTTEGQQYEVETLTWNGKNYRVSGNIKPI